ncbi:lipase [Schleiferilactobacillus harbinensis]|jgi:lysophospholipase L1-like esterase|uniref:Lipase n=2 Tax=Schleiferilactobacillus harbinensis TaxID=304207 RepID=A0A510TV94_9LACO|nr:SGNH/GDSL hydrolase family protein [Schleiferilactobacillus harbinensis]HAY53589.1 lipase [Lactobacillus sp.]KRM28387.1 lipase acylhydrolase [Schleiferilactobacillus harbinensis DSM 16991]MBO3090817.1 SGNH/GDSL hydrolase family protein [Schleiferilactobacillus harbinensis]MCI1687291.1 SGNH/GDSL hydrolase family protein [Schleiferilactobacillus harbinensis]MCI1782588.1 SGNH/GDSL hydrolase family protein [Schleiferilactobacillus harbinensis]
MKKLGRWLVNIALLAAVTAVVSTLLLAVVPAADLANVTPKGQTAPAGKTYNLVAIGDSLTYGTGDEANQGGFVGQTVQRLQSDDDLRVNSVNFGHPGDTAQQILTRVEKQPAIAKNVKQADLITITAGGNDLMQTLMKNGADLNSRDVTKAEAAFGKNMEKMVTTLRSQNAHAPIYILGVYNPFYVYFSQVTQLQTIMHGFNQRTKTMVKRMANVYYVDVDSVLTKGDGTVAKSGKVTSAKSLQEQIADNDSTNPYLSTSDHFHPNHIGYGRMTDQLLKVLKKTKGQWQ